MSDRARRASQPCACPTCGIEQDFNDSLSHQMRDEGLEFLWECDGCGNKFTTISDIDVDPIEDHTFMWAEQDEEITEIFHIEGDEENAGVVAKRAEFNMRGAESYEVHGREWAVARLYELFAAQHEFSEEYEGPLQLPWINHEEFDGSEGV